MAFNLQYKKSVAKDLARIGKTEARQLLDKIEKELSSHPDRYPVLQGPLAGLGKMRMGDYRVIYAIPDNDVLVLRIGNRRTVCRERHSNKTLRAIGACAPRPTRRRSPQRGH